MRKRRVEAPRGGGVPIGVVVVLVLALVGVGAFALAPRQRERGPWVGDDEAFESFLDDQTDREIRLLEEDNIRRGRGGSGPEERRIAFPVVRAAIRERSLVQWRSRQR